MKHKTSTEIFVGDLQMVQRLAWKFETTLLPMYDGTCVALASAFFIDEIDRSKVIRRLSECASFFQDQVAELSQKESGASRNVHSLRVLAGRVSAVIEILNDPIRVAAIDSDSITLLLNKMTIEPALQFARREPTRPPRTHPSNLLVGPETATLAS